VSLDNARSARVAYIAIVLDAVDIADAWTRGARSEPGEAGLVAGVNVHEHPAKKWMLRVHLVDIR